MQYKLLALDIDGTLINDKKEIPPRVRAAVRAAVEKGCFVMLATGRMYRAMEHINASLGLEMPCMVYGGGQIVKDGKVIFDQPLDGLLAQEVLQWCHEQGMYAQAYDSNDFFFETPCEFSDEYEVFCDFPGVCVPDLRQKTDLRTPKILVIGDPKEVDRYEKMVVAHFGERLKVSRSKPRFLELNDPSTSKGRALDFLVQSMGLTRDNVIAMGDATLDLPMIEYAGLGVAMANADELTKSKADLVCPSNNEDGVAYVIERYILGD